MFMLFFFLVLCSTQGNQGNDDAKRLYDDLINGYNSLIRPVGNNSDRLTVKMGLRLSQLIDVAQFSFLILSPRIEAIRKLYWDGPRDLGPWSDDEDDT
ncbi:Acetylcholine receptor subunit alpha-like 1 [Araneus ventricosus]|uniref:Acetylcholine receptor subunit alpha-like 1 n=1 Tax=Araneus ventricosus TaxID=182803 RepID=A0A4Y2QYG5_ARAVE|nr:Acetylcholine receptor subunit alpha-like 1 [Araneus ventricosus]